MCELVSSITTIITIAKLSKNDDSSTFKYQIWYSPPQILATVSTTAIERTTDSSAFLSVSERFVAEIAVTIGSRAINKNPVQNLNLSLKGELYASKIWLS